jgi:hypothetical protein
MKGMSSPTLQNPWAAGYAASLVHGFVRKGLFDAASACRPRDFLAPGRLVLVLFELANAR